VEVRRSERVDVALACGALFTFMVSHGVLETARDALFLTRLPPERLPWVYLAIATMGLGTVRLTGRVRAEGRRLAASLAIAAMVTTLLALVAPSGGSLVAYLVYVWTGLSATVITIQLWQLAADRFQVGQAKRRLAFIGAGGVVGVAAGSALAALLANHAAPTELLMVGGGLLAMACLQALLMRSTESPTASSASSGERDSTLRVVREEPHARRLLLLALASTITLTVADYLFKSRVAASIAPQHLALFFGQFYAAVNILALSIQIGATAWLFRKVGAPRSLAVLPSAVFVGAMAFTTAPVLPSIVAVKAMDGALRHSLHRTGSEVMFLPLPVHVRRSIKGVVEVIGQRGGQALASAGILVAVALNASPRAFGVLLAVLAVVWLIGLKGARRAYPDL
jgi:ATP/ADP translocase